mgnify:CR=1 FL=1
MKFKFLIQLSVVLILFISCAAKVPVQVNQRADMEEIVNNPETTLVDVRIPEQFAEKTAAGAINIPLAKIEDNIDFFKKQQKVVIFCNSGFQANQAVELLKKNGVQNVYDAKTLKNVDALQHEK